MRKYILLIISVLIGVACSAQKYKAVYESIKNMDENEAYQTLEAFSKLKNNCHSASLYKMALIIEHQTASFDPFLQEKAITQNIYTQRLYLNLALHNLDEKVARQDGVYFDSIVPANPKKGPSLQEITDDLNNRISRLNLYNQYFEHNRKTLFLIANKYNNCIELFGEINQRNSKLKDLYFLVDNDLRQQLSDLKTNFDSTIYYLNALQKSLAEYPMLNYKFKYKLNPINIYRMHGLTQANLLAPEIQLWDFSQWIDDFYKTIDNEVGYLYDNVKAYDNLHERYVDMLSKGINDSVPDNYQVPQYLLNKIYKYDFKSMASNLLISQQAQINYLSQLASFQNDTSFFAFGQSLPANNFFSLSIEKKRVSDSLLTDYEKAINDEGIKKYSTIFVDKYKGESGIKQSIQRNINLNKQLFDNKVNAFAHAQIEIPTRDTASRNFLLYKSDTIFAQLLPQTEVKNVGYYIHTKAISSNKQTLVAGSYVSKKNERLGFVAQIDTVKNIVWLQQLKQGVDNRTCLHVAAMNDEIVAIVTSTSKTGAISNTIILLDNAGNVKLTKKLSATEMPRKLLVDDIANQYIVVFGGKSQLPYSMEKNNLDVCCLDANFNVVWQKNLPFVGYLCNVITTNNIYHISGAFTKITGFDNETIDLKDGAGFFDYSIGGEGNWLTDNYYETDVATYPVWVSKIDNTRMEVISVLGAEPQQTSDADVNAQYIQYSFEGDELFKNK